ncbi:hypothetical protein [Hahella sp. NBU794]|uniref:hypothetical protein n=1 Tax=Hahella sp. NBU794 TaxID=3422590 RepID=UPI003D701049
MTTRETKPWNLEQFLDSLILELDKAQDTLSLKGLTRKLTYTVKDVALDLNIFPVLEDGKVKFQMAKPGETGGSRISFQLGSITDRQIRENANEPPSKDDVQLDTLEDVDDEVKESLRKVGVTSTRDLEKLNQRNVNIENVVKEKTGGEKSLDYSDLANLINKARRRKLSPQLSTLSAKEQEEAVELTLRGSNFVLQQSASYPAAMVNNQKAEVLHADAGELRLKVPRQALKNGDNALAIALDPYAVMQLNLQS